MSKWFHIASLFVCIISERINCVEQEHILGNIKKSSRQLSQNHKHRRNNEVTTLTEAEYQTWYTDIERQILNDEHTCHNYYIHTPCRLVHVIFLLLTTIQNNITHDY